MRRDPSRERGPYLLLVAPAASARARALAAELDASVLLASKGDGGLLGGTLIGSDCTRFDLDPEPAIRARRPPGRVPFQVDVPSIDDLLNVVPGLLGLGELLVAHHPPSALTGDAPASTTRYRNDRR